MEALTAVAVAALTVYDMCKAVDRGMRIERHPPRAQGRRPLRRVSGGRLTCCRSPRRRRASWPSSGRCRANGWRCHRRWAACSPPTCRRKRDQPPSRSRPWTAMRCAPPIPPKPERLLRRGRRGRGRRATIRQAIGAGRGGADLHRRRRAARRRRGRDPGERRAASDGGVRFSAAVAPGHIRAPGRARLPPRLDRTSSRDPARRPRRWASPPRWAMSGCPCGVGRAIGLLATGNELRWPGETLEGSQISSSNTVMPSGRMVTGWGAQPVDLGICPDDGEALAARVREAAGPRSAGHHGRRLGRRLRSRPAGAWARRACALDFWKIAMRPGKPLLFGRLGAVPVLGFPGNPVSTGVCAIVFLRPALQKLLGPADSGCRSARAGLPNSLAANDQRQDYLRGALRRRARPSSRRTAARGRTARCWPPSPRPMRWWCAHRSIPRARPGDMVTIVDLHEALDNLR